MTIGSNYLTKIKQKLSLLLTTFVFNDGSIAGQGIVGDISMTAIDIDISRVPKAFDSILLATISSPTVAISQITKAVQCPVQEGKSTNE